MIGVLIGLMVFMMWFGVGTGGCQRYVESEPVAFRKLTCVNPADDGFIIQATQPSHCRFQELWVTDLKDDGKGNASYKVLWEGKTWLGESEHQSFFEFPESPVRWIRWSGEEVSSDPPMNFHVQEN